MLSRRGGMGCGEPSTFREVPWFHAVAERYHDIQNPISAEKIRLLGEQIGLASGQRVLDIACGRGGPAIVLASTFGCEIVGVEKANVFAEAARERIAAAGLEGLISIREGDAADLPIEPEAWDAALCLGATWIWGGLEGTVAALVRCVRRGGHVATGEVYRRGSAASDDELVSLAETVRRFERAGPPVTALITASTDDWDAYESLHWASLEEWLAENRDDPGAEEIRAEHERSKWHYLERGRETMGWAILAGRKL
jgi:ubiquinone/menaquinone biosynthesis C-methylase UbiE